MQVTRKADGSAEVLRVSPSGDGWVEESRHIVKDGFCDCPGFKYNHGRCAHLDAVAEACGGPVEIAQARAAAMDVMSRWPGLTLPDEPYERDEKGMVKCVLLDGKMPSAYKSIWWAWQGVKIKVRLNGA